MKKLELYTTLGCPHCVTMKRNLEKILPDFSDAYQFKEISASSPIGYLKSLKNNIHSAPTLLIDGKVVARTALNPSELTQLLKSQL